MVGQPVNTLITDEAALSFMTQTLETMVQPESEMMAPNGRRYRLRMIATEGGSRFVSFREQEQA